MFQRRRSKIGTLKANAFLMMKPDADGPLTLAFPLKAMGIHNDDELALALQPEGHRGSITTPRFADGLGRTPRGAYRGGAMYAPKGSDPASDAQSRRDMEEYFLFRSLGKASDSESPASESPAAKAGTASPVRAGAG